MESGTAVSLVGIWWATNVCAGLFFSLCLLFRHYVGMYGSHRVHACATHDPTACCPICLDGLDAHKCVQTTCNHKFHAKCLEVSFLQTSPRCPICRMFLARGGIGPLLRDFHVAVDQVTYQ